MTQITLTLDMTPHNVAVLSEVLPRFEMGKQCSNEMAPMDVSANDTQQTASAENAVTNGDTSGKAEEKKTAPAKAKADKAKDAAPAPENKPADKAATTKGPSMTDVRAVALKLSKAGKQDTLKALFAKYNADKLSGVAESDYLALLEDLEAANAES